MRVIVTGGGTGGHVYPALSIIEALKEKDSSIEFLYVGTERGIESRIVRHQRIPFEALRVEGLNRKLSLATVKRVFLLAGSLVGANRLLSKFRPDFVIGTGGYVSFPILYAASLRKIPVFIHEQNAVPGAANKVLSRKARKMFISFPDSKDHLDLDDSRIVVTGNPVRQSFEKAKRGRSRKALDIPHECKMILAFGGSGGAEKLNQLVLDLARTLGARRDIRIIHATGNRYYKTLSAQQDLPSNLDLMAYIDDMPTYMAACDLMIGRAGAITLAEISTLGIPSILMPSPNVANNHQMENARAFEKMSAAMIVDEQRDDPDEIILKIIRLVDDDERLMKMGRNSKKVLQHNAAARIAEEILREMK